MMKKLIMILVVVYCFISCKPEFPKEGTEYQVKFHEDARSYANILFRETHPNIILTSMPNGKAVFEKNKTTFVMPMPDFTIYWIVYGSGMSIEAYKDDPAQEIILENPSYKLENRVFKIYFRTAGAERTYLINGTIGDPIVSDDTGAGKTQK